MRVLPIDVSAFSQVLCVGVRPKMFRETADSEPRQRTGSDGVTPQWTAEILFRGDEDQKSDLEEVTLTQTSKPEIDGPIEFTGLVGVSWTMGDRHGIAFRADSISKAGESAPARPARQAQTEQKGSES